MAANGADVAETAHFLHGDEQAVCGDSSYIGAEKRSGLKDRPAQWYFARKPGHLKAKAFGARKKLSERVEHLKLGIRTRAIHLLHNAKNLFCHRKVRYQGLANNARLN